MSDKCEHKSGKVLHEGDNFTIVLCEWGCGDVVLCVDGMSDETIVHVPDAPELAALRAVAFRADMFLAVPVEENRKLLGIALTKASIKVAGYLAGDWDAAAGQVLDDRQELWQRMAKQEARP
jgi:hypothetical protein